MLLAGHIQTSKSYATVKAIRFNTCAQWIVNVIRCKMAMSTRSLASNLLWRQAARPAFGITSTTSAASRFSPAVPFKNVMPIPFSCRRFLSDVTRSAIDKAVASAPVVLFMKGTPEMPQCGFSRGVIQILGLQCVDPAKFAAFNVLEDPELRQGIKEYSDWPTIPQLYIEREFVGGADIVQNMFKSGDLGKMLESKGLVVPAEEKQ
ncbi:hypothetical protein CDD81_7542 [Ophiocordyceps australis]|uniref:Monothiol glutaredoxin-5, mitochondrial n=1 Tax=Ophiocordyceps australis TaxID=1399860 RepID=A0A2C5Y5F0_9HYPO|nr:hypothetical protein CDD81_7542 [Ophiocordyceps australis]